MLAHPFQHQGDPLSTKTFKVSEFTKAMKALHLPEAQISAIRKSLQRPGELLIGGSVRGVNRIFRTRELVAASFEATYAEQGDGGA